jgi:hypothetical protein
MGHWLTFANVDWAHRYGSGAGPLCIRYAA